MPSQRLKRGRERTAARSWPPSPCLAPPQRCRPRPRPPARPTRLRYHHLSTTSARPASDQPRCNPFAVLSKVMVYAIKTKVLRDNPFAGIECYKLGTYHTWTEVEIAQFEPYWEIGTRERASTRHTSSGGGACRSCSLAGCPTAPRPRARTRWPHSVRSMRSGNARVRSASAAVLSAGPVILRNILFHDGAPDGGLGIRRINNAHQYRSPTQVMHRPENTAES